MSGVIRFLGRSRVNERPWTALVVIALMLVAAVATGLLQSGAPFLGVLGLLIAAAVVPARIEVGRDGVRVAWICARFFPFSAVTGVRAARRDAVLELTGGRRVLLPIAPKNRSAREASRREELLARVHEALLEYRRGGAEVRGLEAAVERQLRVASGAAGDAYRTETVEPATLWRVLETPAASTGLRIGAAACLSPSLDEAGRDRIRVAAETSASPGTRAALRRVAARPLEEDELRQLLASSERRATRRGKT